jgi:hypothetical protein
MEGMLKLNVRNSCFLNSSDTFPVARHPLSYLTLTSTFPSYLFLSNTDPLYIFFPPSPSPVLGGSLFTP